MERRDSLGEGVKRRTDDSDAFMENEELSRYPDDGKRSSIDGLYTAISPLEKPVPSVFALWARCAQIPSGLIRVLERYL